MDYRLPPSGLTYTFEDCKRCFYLQIREQIQRPSIPLPQVFNRIDAVQNGYYAGMRTDDFCPELPGGVVLHGQKWVQSDTVTFPSTSSRCYISGRFDIVIRFDDGSYGVIDFKTREEGEEPTAMYARQLQAYAYSLENPAPGVDGIVALSPVTKLGLLYFAPTSCELRGSRQSLSGQLSWVEVAHDSNVFVDFLEEVVTVLDGSLPPAQVCDACAYCVQPETRCKAASTTPAGRDACTCCAWCNYRARTSVSGY